MYSYKLNRRLELLDELPPLTESYPTMTVLEGNPVQSGRIDYLKCSDTVMAGEWCCTRGRFRLSYPFAEMATILDGRIIVTDEIGISVALERGDSFFVGQGETVEWEIIEDMRKSHFTFIDEAVPVVTAATG